MYLAIAIASPQGAGICLRRDVQSARSDCARALIVVATAVLFCVRGAVAASNPPFVGPEVGVFLFHPHARGVVYAGTYLGGVFKTTNHGARWSPANTGLPENAAVWSLAMDPRAPDTLYAGIQGRMGSGLYKSVDGGKSWRKMVISIDLPSQSRELIVSLIHAIRIDPADSKTIYATAKDVGPDRNNVIIKSTDAGFSWNAVHIGKRLHTGGLTIDPANPRLIYAGVEGSILASADAGATWSERGRITFISRIDGTERPVWVGRISTDLSTRSANLYASSGAGLYRSTDQGATWRRLEGACGRYALSPLPGVLFDSCSPRQQPLSVTGSLVHKSVDSGKTWVPAQEGLPDTGYAPAFGIDPTDPGTVYASWANGGVFTSKDGGNSWKAAHAGLTWEDICTAAGLPVRPYACAPGKIASKQ